MSANDQARSLMMRHSHLIKNRQQSMLSRLNSEIGMTNDVEYLGTIQGKLSSQARANYDRSGSALS